MAIVLEQRKCPHCEVMFGKNRFGAHVKSCVCRPAVRDLLVSVLQSDVPGVGITKTEYTAVYRNHGLPVPSTLCHSFGNEWANVLEKFGLKSSRRTYNFQTTPAQREAKRKQEQEKEATVDVAVVKAEAYANEIAAVIAEEQAPRGLPVLRVRPWRDNYVICEIR